MNLLQPAPAHKFAFGLGTVVHAGRHASGEHVGPPVDASGSVHRLAHLGAWGVSLYDDDLVPPGSTAGECADIVDRFRKTLDDAGMVASTAAADVSRHPVFEHGAFTASDPKVRRLALRKTMRAIDIGVECGAEIHLLPGGGEEGEAPVAMPLHDALDRYREAIDFLCGYVEDQGYPTRFALVPAPGESCGHAFLPTTGHALAFIETLDHAEMVGLSPAVAHETTVGASVYHGVAQAVWAGKLFSIDFDGGHLRGGSGAIDRLFLLVKLLEDSGYDGPRHFVPGPRRLEGREDLWDFVAGCMRTYLALAAKCRRFADDLDIREALEHTGAPQLAEPTVGAYSKEAAEQLTAETFDPQMITNRGDGNERLGQLVAELLLGLR